MPRLPSAVYKNATKTVQAPKAPAEPRRSGQAPTEPSAKTRSTTKTRAKKPHPGAIAILEGAVEAHADALELLAENLSERRSRADLDGGAMEMFSSVRGRIDLSPLAQEIARLDRDSGFEALAARVGAQLFASLGRSREPLESSPLLVLLLRIHEGLLSTHSFRSALVIIEGARAACEHADTTTDRKKRERGLALLEYLVDRPHLEQLIKALNEKRDIAHDPSFAALIDAVAPYSADYLLNRLDAFLHPEHRAWICELLSRSVELEPSLLEAAAPKLSPESLTDLLAIGFRQPQAISASVVVDALENADKRVRALGVALLAYFPSGDADRWLQAMLRDPDEMVRDIAARVHAHRSPEPLATTPPPVPAEDRISSTETSPWQEETMEVVDDAGSTQIAPALAERPRARKRSNSRARTKPGRPTKPVSGSRTRGSSKR
jgi:hypothetical protein